MIVVAMAATTVSADAAGFGGSVTGVKAVSKSYNSVQVSCDKMSGAVGYCFYVSSKANGKYKLKAKTKAHRAVISGLSTDKEYFFKVRAFKGTSHKTYSGESNAVAATPKLKTPRITQVKMSGYFNETVKWSAVSGAKKYRVYRSKYKNKKFKRIGTVSANTFKGKVLKQKTVYYYKIKAIRGKHKSEFSKVKKFRSPPNGNLAKYGLGSISRGADNELTGKTVYFLGSSITYGLSSQGESFADYVCKQCGAVCHKRTYSGTTMALCKDKPKLSYVERLTSDSFDGTPDIFLCQLSLNDANHKLPLGTISDELPNLEDMNLNQIDTVAEAIEYITAYAKTKWPNCQIAFYTVKNNGNARYAEMVKLLKTAQVKWGQNMYDRNLIEILNIWDDKSFMNVTGDTLRLYMRDDNHPTKAGYKICWLPRVKSFLLSIVPLEIPPEEPTDDPDPTENGDGQTMPDPTDSSDPTDPTDPSDPIDEQATPEEDSTEVIVEEIGQWYEE